MKCDRYIRNNKKAASKIQNLFLFRTFYFQFKFGTQNTLTCFNSMPINVFTFYPGNFLCVI